MAIIDTNKKFIEINITAADRMLTKELSNPKTGYFDSPYSFLVERIEGKDEAETLRLSKERFLGRIARGAAIPDMLAFEKQVLNSAAMANGSQAVHVIIADPGVGKTYEFKHLVTATGWNSIQVNPEMARNADEFFIAEAFSDGTTASKITRLSNAITKGEGISENDRKLLLQRLVSEALPKTEKNLPDFGSFDDTHWKKFESLIPTLADTYLVQLPQKSSIGFKKGHLLEALIEARDNSSAPLLIYLDEGNYYQYGATAREFIAFMNGGNGKEFIVQFQDINGNYVDEHFTRDQLKHVQVMVTCNKPDREREPNAKDFSVSLESRFQTAPITVTMDAGAMAHRFATEFMSLPLTTHLDAAERYGLTGEKLTTHLQDLLTLGMNAQEIKMASRVSLATAMLGQAPRVCEGANHLGAALFEINQLLLGDDGAEAREALSKVPHMDGRFIETLRSYMETKINNVTQPQDKDGNLIKGENPYRILDKEGKTVIETTPQNIGSRAVRGILLFLNETFPAHNNAFASFRADLGKILAENYVITLERAATDFGAEQGVQELMGQSIGTSRIEDTVEGLINVVPPRYKSEEYAAAGDYLYNIIASQYPNMVSGISPQEFKNATLPPQKVEALMNQYAALYEGVGKENLFVVPGVDKNAKGDFVATLREGQTAVGAAEIKKMGNQSEAGIYALLLGNLARNDGAANPLDALFTAKIKLDAAGIADRILGEFSRFAVSDTKDENNVKIKALDKGLAEILQSFVSSDSPLNKENLKIKVGEFYKANKKFLDELFQANFALSKQNGLSGNDIDAALIEFKKLNKTEIDGLKPDDALNRLQERTEFILEQLLEKGPIAAYLKNPKPAFDITTVMEKQDFESTEGPYNQMGFRICRYHNHNGDAVYSIASDFKYALSDDAKKTLSARNIAFYNLGDEEQSKEFEQRVQYQLQDAAKRIIADQIDKARAAADKIAQEQSQPTTFKEPSAEEVSSREARWLREFRSERADYILGSPPRGEQPKDLDTTFCPSSPAVVANEIVQQFAGGGINPHEAHLVYAEKIISTAANDAPNLPATKSQNTKKR